MDKECAECVKWHQEHQGHGQPDCFGCPVAEKMEMIEARDEDMVIFRGEPVRDFGRPIDGEY
jgi:hypothetical protein